MDLFMTRSLLSISWFFCLCCAGTSSCAEDPETLLRLVPDDMHLCVVLDNLREKSARSKDDDFLTHALKNMPYLQSLANSPDADKLKKFQKQIQHELGITFEQIRDDLLGDVVVLALKQHNGEKGDNQDHKIFMIRARDEKLLATSFGRLNQMMKKSGEIKEILTRKYSDYEYVERQRNKNGSATQDFCYLSGNLLIYSDQEAALKNVLDRLAEVHKKKNRFSYWMQSKGRLGDPRALISIYLNPRAYDAEFQSSMKDAPRIDSSIRKEFYNYWKAIDGVCLALVLEKNLDISVSLDVRTGDLPVAARAFFAEFGKPSALWSVIPKDALFALSARLPPTAMAQVLAGFVDPSQRDEMQSALEVGLRPFLAENAKAADLLNGFEPDVGFWIQAPESATSSWVPRAILALPTSSHEMGRTTQTTFHNVIQFMITAAQINDPQLKVHHSKHDGIDIKSLKHDKRFPVGFQPAFASKNNYLLVASSPSCIQQFRLPARQESKEGGVTPVCRISVTAWRQYLQEHKEGMAPFLEQSLGLPRGSGSQILTRLAENLRPFAALEIYVQGSKNKGVVTLHITASMTK